jgi:hypothetical protein
LLRLPQFYTILRMLLSRELTPQRKLLLLARILDLLERDFHDSHPNEKPPIEGGYEAFVRKVLIPQSES